MTLADRNTSMFNVAAPEKWTPDRRFIEYSYNKLAFPTTLQMEDPTNAPVLKQETIETYLMEIEAHLRERAARTDPA